MDYLRVRNGIILPVEVKANTQGSMQSLWIFMRKRKLHEAIRTSLENFGQFDHYDPEDELEQRHIGGSEASIFFMIPFRRQLRMG